METRKEQLKECEQLALQIGTHFSMYRYNVDNQKDYENVVLLDKARSMVKRICYKSAWVTDEEISLAPPKIANMLLKNAFRIYIAEEINDGLTVCITGARMPKPIVHSVKVSRRLDSFEYIPGSITTRIFLSDAFEWFIAVIIDPVYIGHAVINNPSMQHRWPMINLK